MCGITGIFDTRGRRDIDRRVLSRMNESQYHRGPDEGGLHLEPGVGLGHRRLSIIDLSTGQQPLFNEDGSVVVVFNGEIYNYPGTDPRTAGAGARFPHPQRYRSHRSCLGSLGRGLRAALSRHVRLRAVGSQPRNLFLARDRLGVKPLYYALLPDGCFLFGSELKSLLAHGGLGARYRSPGGRRVLRARLRGRATHHLSSGRGSCRRHTC
jgi:asparagine synthase (glutamine-hydrolysing)